MAALPSSPHDTARAWLEVDLDAVRHNVAVLRARAGVPLLIMVKADGYGLGAAAVCRALGVPFRDEPAPWHAEPPWGVGIATLDEAEALRRDGCAGRIVCLQPLLPDELPRAAQLQVTPSLHRVADIEAWARMYGGAYHLSVDTGMARAGVRWDAVASLGDVLRAHPPEGIFTHFHSADDSRAARDEQDARFDAVLAALRDRLSRPVLEHRDNSGAITTRAAGSPGHLARPGIALYAGLFAAELGLRQVAHLRARIIDLREVHAGEPVSYGATWVAPATRRIATVAIGYADGYRRHLSNAGVVLINGIRCPVVGRVTMDMTMVDVTAVPCEVSTVVTLLGRDGHDELGTEMVAGLGGVSPYELLTGLAQRVPTLHRTPSTSTSVVA